jgi:hypothetical protein
VGAAWVVARAEESPVKAGTGAEPDERAGCSDRTVRGTYAIQMQGTRPVPPPAGGGIETVIGVVLRTYDGAGSFTQIDNVKGSVTGIVPDRFGAGTYTVTADCLGTTLFQPGPGVLLEERMVIVDRGDEIRSITSSPLPVMVSTLQQRSRCTCIGTPRQAPRNGGHGEHSPCLRTLPCLGSFRS